MKKYLIFSLKRYIPLFVVSFAVCFFTFITTFGGSIPTQVTIRYYSESYYTNVTGSLLLNSGILSAVIPVAIFTMLLPFFANSYRYSLQSADTFYQIGKNKKSIRWVNNLLLLGSFIAILTVAFTIAIGILFVRQLPNIGRPDEVTYVSGEVTEVTRYVFFNFGYYVPAYLLIVVFAILNYAISYFFVTRANNLVDSIILLILGEFILAIGIMTPIWFTMLCQSLADNGDHVVFMNESFLIGTRTSCFVSPIAWIIYFFDGLITGNESLFVRQMSDLVFDGPVAFGLAMSIVCVVIFFAVAGFGIYKFLTEKESSGELAGKPVGRDTFQYIIFHMAFGLIGLWIGSLQSLLGSSLTVLTNQVFAVVLFISEMGFFGAAYYVLFGLLRRNFRMNKKELILFISIVGTDFIIDLSLLIAAISRSTIGL